MRIRNVDDAIKFLNIADSILNSVRFVVSSLPAVSDEAVHHALSQLSAVSSAIESISSDSSSVLPQTSLQIFVDEIAQARTALLDFLTQPTENPVPNFRRPEHVQPRNGPGRPSAHVDLDEVEELAWQGATMDQIARRFKVSRSTIYYHLDKEGRNPPQRHSQISDEELDHIVKAITDEHPFIGSVIIGGHLSAGGLRIQHRRVQHSLRRVDPIGIAFRLANTIKRRVYSVRGANSLWHMDGNEKLRPWGFYVHGCVDGYSRYVLYLACETNKRSATVRRVFQKAIREMGVPSRVRGDFGTENNGVEELMNMLRGAENNAFLRGKSIQNIRIERLWRDTRKDSFEAFRRVFIYLENEELLLMGVRLHRVALFVVYHHRIQQNLDQAREAWNAHRLSTEHNQSPTLLFRLSKAQGEQEGWWDSNPDPLSELEQMAFGVDDPDGLGPFHVSDDDGLDSARVEAERDQGLRVNSDDEVLEAKGVLAELGFDVCRDDQNWGIDVYVEAVCLLASVYPDEAEEAFRTFGLA